LKVRGGGFPLVRRGEWFPTAFTKGGRTGVAATARWTIPVSCGRRRLGRNACRRDRGWRRRPSVRRGRGHIRLGRRGIWRRGLLDVHHLRSGRRCFPRFRECGSKNYQDQPDNDQQDGDVENRVDLITVLSTQKLVNLSGEAVARRVSGVVIVGDISEAEKQDEASYEKTRPHVS